MAVVVALDAGTTGVRALAIDEASEVVHSNEGFRLARLTGGTSSGRSSVAVIAKVGDKVIILEATLRELVNAAAALQVVEEQEQSGAKH